MDKNHIGWANYLAPLVMGAGQDSELIGELSGSFYSTDPVVAKAFVEATFFSDYRHLLPEISADTLILQSSHDALALYQSKDGGRNQSTLYARTPG